MSKLSKPQFEQALKSILFVFESNYHQFSFTDESIKAFKFMAQGACQSLANNTECDPDIINPILRDALKLILNK